MKDLSYLIINLCIAIILIFSGIELYNSNPFIQTSFTILACYIIIRDSGKY